MIRMLICSFAVAILASGCCGPTGCGPGCGVQDCFDCDGCSQVDPYVGPLQTVRQLRRKMVCGSGCGEVYRGEWRSTPPDCEDPCCGGQWVGGATVARPFCWQPGAILSLFPRLYGGRFCDGCGELFSDCDCCGDGQVIDGGVISEGGSCGCASCSGDQINGTRMATQHTRTAGREPMPKLKSP